MCSFWVFVASSDIDEEYEAFGQKLFQRLGKKIEKLLFLSELFGDRF